MLKTELKVAIAIRLEAIALTLDPSGAGGGMPWLSS